MPGERVTIRQLARLSGVSIGTVSRALNGYSDVNADTRERIIRLAREHDYTPAAAARSLVTQRSHVVGVFLETGEGHPDLQHPFFHEVLVGLKNVIGDNGYDLLLFASDRPGNGYGEHSYLKRCRHHAVEGAVLMGVDPDDPEVRRLLRSGLPCVGVDVECIGPSAAYVVSDNESGSGLAVRHLYELGHRRIGTVAGAENTRPGADRVRGYRRALRELGLPYRDEYVVFGDFYLESGRRLAGRAARPAGAADGDRRRLGHDGPGRAARRVGPRPAAARGPLGGRLRRHAAGRPRAPVADDPAAGQARARRGGGRALLARIDGSEDQPLTITLPVDLVERASTAPPG